ncbi:LytR/AlgR family response regulator transcription factor [Companilactobacillus kimchiensis]|uniref:Response regulator n=1 Tax=Companilactobacillus kimchiensis TaxID=993692 RepID=A0A0R2LMQ8_9LACO|nr:LytTR family DNA-binding domain-containing protein [Companilactobacillus kimchiensis]KRO00754.1 response regulator [Companilactobacillus kimchiensis]
MIDIFVCEDNAKQMTEIVSYISSYLLMENFDMEIKLATNDPQEILDYLDKNNVNKGLYFLDIDLKTDLNGIELAAKIRQEHFNSKIVFVTTHSEMVFLTFKYQIEALDYILKDFPNEIQKRITAAIVTCNRQFKENESQSEEYYQIKTGNHLRLVKISDILFFESSPVPHKVIVHLINGQFEFYSTVKKIETENKIFFRCHKSYIVNIDNIRSINRHTRELTMIDEEKIPSSVLACRTLVKLVQEGISR